MADRGLIVPRAKRFGETMPELTNDEQQLLTLWREAKNQCARHKRPRGILAQIVPPGITQFYEQLPVMSGRSDNGRGKRDTPGK